ncbi:MAG: hypothetical protein K2P51_01445, partial [Rhabdochlamydiaceae bacterium]|nr:hypothetical protein [Rhabdochlamydiaceae bacterium]
MSHIKTYIHGLILATTPSLLLYPEAPPSVISESKSHSYDLTYDDMIDFIHAIESGELENKYSAQELDRVIEWIAYLAQQGV